MQPAEHVDAALPTDGSVDSGSAAATCFGVSGGGGGSVSRQQSTAVERASAAATCLAGSGQSSRHQSMAVDRAPAAATCDSVSADSVSGGGGLVNRQTLRGMQPVEHVNAALHTDGSVDGGSAAATYVGGSGGDGGVSRQQSTELPLPPRVSASVQTVSLEVALVSVARR